MLFLNFIVKFGKAHCVDLTVESQDKLLQCDHLQETLLTVFLHGTTNNNNLPKFSIKVNLRVPFFSIDPEQCFMAISRKCNVHL